AVARSDQVAGIAMNMDAAATHLGADPVAAVAVKLNLATGHLRAQVHPRVTVDGNVTGSHVGADQLHPAAIAFDTNAAIAGVARNGEKLAQWHLRIAVLHRQGADLHQSLASEVIWRN